MARFVLSGGGAEDGLFGPQTPDSLHMEADDPVFRRVAAGGHADLVTLERTVNPDGRRRNVIVVDDVRSTTAFLSLTPAEGGWRVVVVDSADDMNPHAANALLKTLEEPPARTLIVMVSHAPGRLLATIHSRCCRIALKPLARDQLGEVLTRTLPELAADAIGALAGLAEGSPGRALALADEGGLALYREIMGLLQPLPKLDLVAVHGLGDRLARRGAEDAFRTATGLLGWWLGRMIRAGARDTTPPAVVPEEEGCAARLLAAGGLDRWLEVWDKINRLTAQTEGLNLDRKQVVLNLFTALEDAARA
jgi:DNA polymerase-3 subunit delta'